MIDVVVPAHNEAALIRGCLWSVLSSGLDVRVVVVADGCTDSTVAEASLPGVRVVEIPKSGKAAALNAATPCLRGCSVVYLDADTVLLPGTLRAMAVELDSPSPRFVGPAPVVVR
ncbi:glycosyltransferase, partial [Kibdelosporangium lantanae]